MLEVQNLRAGYGAKDVLQGISLRVDAGEIVALLGANGAGKSTTLLTLAGVLPPRGGTVSYLGQSLPIGADQVLRRGVVLCPEGRRIFPRLTVLENLQAGGLAFSTRNQAHKLERVFSYFPKLAERREQLGGTLSGGEQQMLAISRALMSEPKLLMLDEPSLGLAPIIVERIFEIIQTINREGTTILLVEQNARQALKIAHRGYVLVTGEIHCEDTGAKLLASDVVQKAYLGE
jgi:branched-chain amino acid transport system ATP-binding protein